MFCANCGKQVGVPGRYCVHCGSEFACPNEGSQAPAGFGTTSPSSDFHSLGTAISTWRKTTLELRHRSKPAFDLEWVHSEVDVVMTSSAFIVVASSPVSKVASSAETISMAAIGLAPGVGLIVALPVAVVAEAYEKIFGRHNNLEESALTTLFDVGRLLWIPKTAARFRYFEVRGGFLETSMNFCAVSGAFRHKQGMTDMCLTMDEIHFPINFNEFRKKLEKPGYSLERARFKKSAEVYQLLDAEYPYPNWSKIFGHT